jgi:hypothetical protein
MRRNTAAAGAAMVVVCVVLTVPAFAKDLVIWVFPPHWPSYPPSDRAARR